MNRKLLRALIAILVSVSLSIRPARAQEDWWWDSWPPEDPYVYTEPAPEEPPSPPPADEAPAETPTEEQPPPESPPEETPEENAPPSEPAPEEAPAPEVPSENPPIEEPPSEPPPDEPPADETPTPPPTPEPPSEPSSGPSGPSDPTGGSEPVDNNTPQPPETTPTNPGSTTPAPTPPEENATPAEPTSPATSTTNPTASGTSTPAATSPSNGLPTTPTPGTLDGTTITGAGVSKNGVSVSINGTLISINGQLYEITSTIDSALAIAATVGNQAGTNAFANTNVQIDANGNLYISQNLHRGAVAGTYTLAPVTPTTAPTQTSVSSTEEWGPWQFSDSWDAKNYGATAWDDWQSGAVTWGPWSVGNPVWGDWQTGAPSWGDWQSGTPAWGDWQAGAPAWGQWQGGSTSWGDWQAGAASRTYTSFSPWAPDSSTAPPGTPVHQSRTADYTESVTSTRTGSVTSTRSGTVESTRSGSVAVSRSGTATATRSGSVTSARSGTATSSRSGNTPWSQSGTRSWSRSGTRYYSDGTSESLSETGPTEALSASGSDPASDSKTESVSDSSTASLTDSQTSNLADSRTDPLSETKTDSISDSQTTSASDSSTSSSSGSETQYQTVDGTATETWSPFDEMVRDWYPTSNWSPDPVTVPAGQSFTQSRNEQQDWRRGERSDRGNERNVENYHRNRTVTQPAVGTMEVWTAFDDLVRDWYPTGNWSPDAATIPNGQSFTQTRSEQQDWRRGERSNLGNERNVVAYNRDRTASQPAVGTLTYSLVTAANGPGTVTPGGTYNPNVSLTISATTSTGRFLGWSGDATGSTNPLLVTMDRNKALTALFGAKIAQTISFAPPSTVRLGASGSTVVPLAATASSGLPVAFALVSGPATLVGNTLTINGAGTVLVQALQPGDATYAAAPPVSRSISSVAGANVKQTNRDDKVQSKDAGGSGSNMVREK